MDASVGPTEIHSHPTASRMSSFELIDHPSTTNTSFSSVHPDIQSVAQIQEFDGTSQPPDMSNSQSMHQLSDAVRNLRVSGGGTTSSSPKSPGLAMANGLVRSDIISSEDPTQPFPLDLST